MKRNIIIGMIAVILCILLAYYWYSLNVVKEGWDFYNTTSTTMISKLMITGGADYLHLSALTIKDRAGNIIPYSTSNISSASNKGYIVNYKGFFDSGSTLDKLYDNNPNTFFCSRYTADMLILSFFSPVDIGSIYIRNRTDCCLTRLSNYKLYLLSNDTTIVFYTPLDNTNFNGLYDPGSDYANTYHIDPPISTITGPPGAKGDKGDKGDKGTTGDKGTNGEKGAKGDKGDKGETGDGHGVKGEKGDKGDMGPTGAIGPIGPAGDDGWMGPTGPTGPVGLNGMNGQMGGPVGLNMSDYFNASSIQTVEEFSIIETFTEPMTCLSSPAYYI